MPDIATIIDEFFGTFNETDPDRRRQAVAAAWTPDARYLDERYQAAGHEEIGQLAKELQAAFPGYRFRRITPVEAHHGRARWRWELTAPGGGLPVASGTDFGVVAADGRLREVVGFYETVRDPAGM